MDDADLNVSITDIILDYDDQSSYKDHETSTLTYLVIEDLTGKMSITLYSIIFVLGTIGNGLVIWIAGFRMKRTVSAVWFLNLAIADFLCCASLPLRIAQWYSSSPHLVILCTFSIILFNLNMSASVLLLTAMSIDRWVSVMWPFWAKVHRTHKLVRITAAIIWVLSLLLTGLVFYYYVFHFWNFSEWCVSLGRDTNYFYLKEYRISQLIRLVILFLIPFLIILISYVTIFFTLRKSKRPHRSQKPYKIVTAIVSCFFICWLPYYIWPLTPMYYGEPNQYHMLNTMVINLACLNSCINPIIYVFLGQDFRHGFCRSIPSRIGGALSDQ